LAATSRSPTSLTTLFFAVLTLDPTEPAAPLRDRFILSKGHCAAPLYSTLAMRGFFPAGMLKTFVQPLSVLNGHPNRKALGSRRTRGRSGSNWEAAMCAGHRRLDNLRAIVDRNRLQQGARTEDTNPLEPLADRWCAFGWEVVACDGHDHAALYDAFVSPRESRPRGVIANTIKGKGVSFIEDRVEWHHKVPSPEQVELALKELA
jgi:transketolase